MSIVASDRKAVVTGGASGIGYEIVRRLLAEGAWVGMADVNEEALSKAAEELNHERLVPFAVDVTDPTVVRSAVSTIADRFGGLDTLVNSAGVYEVRAFEEIDEAGFDRVIGVNLKGTFFCSQATMPYLKRSGRGRIVNVASISGTRGWPNEAHYCAAKFGVVGLTQALAVEFGSFGITVNAVCPASIPGTGIGQYWLRQKAESLGKTTEEVLRSDSQAYPLGRLGTVADIADAIVFLVGDGASWISGISLSVDGGTLTG